MNHRHLKHQVEDILDASADRNVEVLVRMRTSTDAADEQMMQSLAQTMRRRVMSTSARELLPVNAAMLAERADRPAGRRQQALSAKTFARADRSLTAQAVAWAFQSAVAAGLEESGLAALRPLVQSDFVRDALARVVDQASAKSKSKSKSRPASAEPLQMWTSSSAVFILSRDDLAKLPEQELDIADIYPNRTLYVPPIVRPAMLAGSVDDNKASAWGVRTIGGLSSWGAYGKRGEGILVGLLDTGVDASHPDLQGKIAKWAEFDARGLAVANSKPHDSASHGTHCAGTIVGGNASGRWIGVAPEAKVAAALVLNGDQGGTDAQILAGIEWAITQGVDVISMSLGGLTMGPDVPSTYTSAILKALRLGIPVITAIGNEGSQTSGSPGNDFLAFSVGATDERDRVAGFSGGRTQVIRQSRIFPPQSLPMVYSKPEVSAPGVAVLSSIPGGKWDHYNGTSMATPHVAGAIALLLSATDIKANVPADQRAFLIQDLLSGSVEELGEAGQDHRYGYGRVDVLRAIGIAKDKGF